MADDLRIPLSFDIMVSAAYIVHPRSGFLACSVARCDLARTCTNLHLPEVDTLHIVRMTRVPFRAGYSVFNQAHGPHRVSLLSHHSGCTNARAKDGCVFVVRPDVVRQAKRLMWLWTRAPSRPIMRSSCQLSTFPHSWQSLRLPTQRLSGTWMRWPPALPPRSEPFHTLICLLLCALSRIFLE